MVYIFDEFDKIDDVFPENLMVLLSDDRREKSQGIRLPLNRKASVIAYLLLRLALLDIYGIDEAVEFVYAERGKPKLKKYPYIHFNLSHARSAVACVVSTDEVGVDVQHIAPVSDRVAKRVLTDDEFEQFTETHVPDVYFCGIWTIKESYFKKTGQGIAGDFKALAASSVTERVVYQGKDYFCCVCGPDMQIKLIGRKDIEQRYK